MEVKRKNTAYETVDWWLLSHREDTLICRLCQERVNVHDFGLKVLVHSMNRMKMRNKNRKTWMSASRPGQEPKQVVAGCPHHKDNHIGGLWKQLITTRFLLGSDLQQQHRRQWSNLPVQSFRCEDMLGFHEQVMILLLSTQEQTAVLHSQVEGRV